nr:MAG TPA: hypothetical protein [Caudoviricetes sp.]
MRNSLYLILILLSSSIFNKMASIRWEPFYFF